MKEKRFLKDNEKLMREWNYEKNINISPNNITIGSEKKYGGNVKKDMNGKQQFIVVLLEIIVRFVQGEKCLWDIMIY